MTDVSRTERAAQLAEALDRVRERVRAGCAAAGRDPAEVRLVGVTKGFPATDVALLADLGLSEFGESRDQEAAPKIAELEALRPRAALRWHMVGRLQRNKAGVLVGTGALLHSLDSLELARTLGRRAVEAGRVVEALVQLELDDRPAAHGIRPDRLQGFVEACEGIEGLRLRGLMVLPAAGADPRPVFARARELAGLLRPDMQDLSMGMSADLEAAVEEGATIVRVGAAIFGPRPQAHGTGELAREPGARAREGG